MSNQSNDFVDNKLSGLNDTLNDIISTKHRLQEAIMSLERVEKEINIMVGNPLKLSYGYTSSVGTSVDTHTTEIIMSRKCSLAEAIWTLVHMYGVERTAIKVNEGLFFKEMDAEVKAITKYDSWGQQEYIIQL